MLTPAIRAMASALPLLVPGVLADHEHPPVAADDLALLAHRLNRRSYLHGPFRLMIQTGWLWRPGRSPLPIPRTGKSRRAQVPRGTRARPKMVAKDFGTSPKPDATTSRPACPAEIGFAERDASRPAGRRNPSCLRSAHAPARSP